MASQNPETFHLFGDSSHDDPSNQSQQQPTTKESLSTSEHPGMENNEFIVESDVGENNEKLLSSTDAIVHSTSITQPLTSNASTTSFFDHPQESDSTVDTANLLNSPQQEQQKPTVVSLTQPFVPNTLDVHDDSLNTDQQQEQHYDPGMTGQYDYTQQQLAEQQYDPTHWIQFDPNVHYYYDEQGGVHYYDPNTNQEYDMSGYDENGNYQYDPNYTDYYAQQGYDPNAYSNMEIHVDSQNSGEHQQDMDSSPHASQQESAAIGIVEHSLDQISNQADVATTNGNTQTKENVEAVESNLTSNTQAKEEFNNTRAFTEGPIETTAVIADVEKVNLPNTDQQEHESLSPVTTFNEESAFQHDTVIDADNRVNRGEESFEQVIAPAVEVESHGIENQLTKDTEVLNSEAQKKEDPQESQVPKQSVQKNFGVVEKKQEEDNDSVAEVSNGPEIDTPQENRGEPLTKAVDEKKSQEDELIEQKITSLNGDRQNHDGSAFDDDDYTAKAQQERKSSVDASVFAIMDDLNDEHSVGRIHQTEPSEKDDEFEDQVIELDSPSVVSLNDGHDGFQSMSGIEAEKDTSHALKEEQHQSNRHVSQEQETNHEDQAIQEAPRDKHLESAGPETVNGSNAPYQHTESQQSSNEKSEEDSNYKAYQDANYKAEQNFGYDAYQNSSLDSKTNIGYEPQQEVGFEIEQTGTHEPQENHDFEYQQIPSFDAQYISNDHAQQISSSDAQQTCGDGPQTTYPEHHEYQQTNSYEPQQTSTYEPQENVYDEKLQTDIATPQQDTGYEHQQTPLYETYQNFNYGSQQVHSYEPQQVGNHETQQTTHQEPEQNRSYETQQTASYEPQQNTSFDAQETVHNESGQATAPDSQQYSSYEPYQAAKFNGGGYAPYQGVINQSPHYLGYQQPGDSVERSATVPPPAIDRASSPRPQLVPCPDPLCEGENKIKAKFCCECGRPLTGVSRATTPAAISSPYSRLGSLPVQNDVYKESVYTFIPHSIVLYQERDIQEKRQLALDYIHRRAGTFDASKGLLWDVVKLMLTYPQNKLGDGGELDKAIIQSISSSNVTTTRLDELENILLEGDREKACEYAKQHDMWGHCLVIASSVEGGELYQRMITQFIQRQLFSSTIELVPQVPGDNKALRMLYSVFQGAGADSVTEFVKQKANDDPQYTAESLKGWKRALALILANRTKNDQEAIHGLGDQLIKLNPKSNEAQLCYLLSPQVSNFKPQSKELDGLFLLELYEFASQTTIQQDYKLILAWWFAALGFSKESETYCDSLVKAIHSNPLTSLDDLKQQSDTTNESENVTSLLSKSTFETLINSIESKLLKHAAVVGNSYTEAADTTVTNSSPYQPTPLGTQSSNAITTPLGQTNETSGGWWVAQESYQPESYQPESYQPENYQPESYQPESYQPESYQPDTSDNYQPTAYTDNDQPETKKYPDTYAPETTDDDDLGFGNTKTKPQVTETSEEKPKEPEEDKKEQEKKGWGIFSLFHRNKEGDSDEKKAVEANLGKKNAFYYDEVQKKWINTLADESTPAAATPPPPPKATTPQPNVKPNSMPPSRTSSAPVLNGPPSVGQPSFSTPPTSTRRSAGGKKPMRSRYVDVLNTNS